jgi:RNA polymerase sigma factor (sigma-70 family)
VLNACRSVLRRRGVARRHAPRIAAGDRQAVEAAEAAAAVDFELRSELFEAFSTLPTRQREVLAFRYYLDASVAETARALRISEGTVRSTASRGLDSLARIMTSRGGRKEA